jgi:phosphomannomutase
MQLDPPIRFGTDGWRGIIADQFTFARLNTVAPIAAQVLAEFFGNLGDRAKDASGFLPEIVVGYDRRFLSPEFALRMAECLTEVGFDVCLAEGFAPTPALSWAAYERPRAVGALVITASHNPAIYSGLKLKGAFGGSVGAEITQEVEKRLAAGIELPKTNNGKICHFDPWENYCGALRTKVNIELIRQQILSGKLTLFVDVMHGAAAGGLAKLLGLESGQIRELRAIADPLFGGGAPEPMPRNLQGLFQQMQTYHGANPEQLAVGFVFDGDGDRIAAVDSQGNFLSSQILIPILIEHLSQGRGESGEVIKTISGSDLIPKVAALYNLPLYETAVGYKYIADRMIGIEGGQAILGGEESGGIGYGNHIPERDALLSALYVLEAIAMSGKDLSALYQKLQQQTSFFSEYDRIDKPLASLETQTQLISHLQAYPLTEIGGRKVIEILDIDGFKFRLEDRSWLLIRFSGTEPVLRLYCEAATEAIVQNILNWISAWVDGLGF